MESSVANTSLVLITVQEAAGLARVRPSTVYAWCERGEVPHLRAGRRVLLDREEFVRWMREKATK